MEEDLQYHFFGINLNCSKVLGISYIVVVCSLFLTEITPPIRFQQFAVPLVEVFLISRQ
jgi:hypothetical protein